MIHFEEGDRQRFDLLVQTLDFIRPLRLIPMSTVILHGTPLAVSTLALTKPSPVFCLRP